MKTFANIDSWHWLPKKIITAVVIGGVCMASGCDKNQNNYQIVFNSPPLTGDNSVKVPPSGKTRRDVSAVLKDSTGAVVENAPLKYSMSPKISGVSLEGAMLIIGSTVKESATVTVTARSKKSSSARGIMEIAIVKDPSLRDFPPNPPEKPGWVLFHTSDFQEKPDPRFWSEYYLRSWKTDAEARADYFIDDGKLYLTAPRNILTRISGIMTFERQNLHRFGTITESRELPVFDGLATKFGYFELRLKMSNTRDGSHFAWWMVGPQDDQHPTATLAADPEGKLYPGDGKGWGVETYFWTNQGAEYDIIEQHSDPVKAGEYYYRTWLPVIHKNGTRDYPGRWYAGQDVVEDERVSFTKKGIDPYNEFHIFGFEWDEDGTKFYLDNELVYTSDNRAAYRMLTIFSQYAGSQTQEEGAYGWDRGIYPKDVIIDYFRIYKKDEPPRPNAIAINHAPYYFEKPSSGTNSAAMEAVVLDQFDRPIALRENQRLRWRFSKDIGGETARTAPPAGLTLDAESGLVTVNAGAPLDQDIFLTAYAEGDDIPAKRGVRETRHIKLSQSPAEAHLVIFNNPTRTVTAGSTWDASAAVYNQYMRKIDAKINYSLVSDVTAAKKLTVPGVSVDAAGRLTVGKNVPRGTKIIVNADSGFKTILDGQRLKAEDAVMQNLIVAVE